jgi:Aerotolerance regulator N-terminal
MSFAYPGFLWALLSLAIPIIIHLFNFRRVQKIFFSNTKLLKQVKEETTKRRRIKNWLVLLSRLLFLLFLVLAFAQPFLPASEQFSSGKNIVLYIDNSYSMSAPMADKTRALDVANNYASEILNLFPQDTRYKLLTNDFAPSSNNYKTKTEIRDLLSQIRFSNINRTLTEIMKRTEGDGNPDIFVISDFQKSTIGRGQLIDTLKQWRLVPVQSPTTNNVFVDSAWFENPYLAGGEKNRLNVWVRNDGSQNADHLSLKLTINNLLAATTTLAVPGNGITKTVFDISANVGQYQELKIALQDFPISFDNEFFMAMAPLQRLKIVEVRGVKATTFIESVYGNRSLFDFKSFPVTNVDLPQLEAADLVVFNELADFDVPIRQLIGLGKIKSYLIVPAKEIKISSYQSVLSLPIQATEKKVGLEIKSEERVKLAAPDFRNPFFENVFEEKSPTMEMPVAEVAFQWGNDPSSILKLRDGRPFLSKTRKGFVLASPLQSEFTDFAQHALFVPVMYKMAALAKQDLQRPYYFMSEQFLSIPSDSVSTEEPLKLTGPKEIIPTQRYVSGKIFMDVPKLTLSQGFYYITSKTDTLGLLAFNLDKDESRMEVVSMVELKKMAVGRKNISVFEPSSNQAFSNEIKARYLGQPLWKYCLALALLFILVEILLIRFLK